ncbi:hypothetical protein ACQ4LE_005708 [Meloidogyne hapla]
MEYLPYHLQLKILQYLNFNELLSLKKTSIYFNYLIDQDKKKLARKEFINIKIINHKEEDELNYKNIDVEYGVVDFPLSGQLMKKWNLAIKNCIPIYLSTGSFQKNDKPAITLFTETNKNKKFVECNGNLILKLPVCPKTLEEMKIVRFWLKRLFHCNFQEALFNDIIINPEIIKLLFDNKETKKLQFHAQIAYLTYCFTVNLFNRTSKENHNCIETVFNFNIDHLHINKLLSLNFGLYYYTSEYNTILLDLIINEGARIPHIQIKKCMRPTFCSLIINYLETSSDYSNIVPIISFDNIYWPRSQLSIRHPQQKVSNGLIINYKEYKSNDAKILIEFHEQTFYGMISKFEIKRIS